MKSNLLRSPVIILSALVITCLLSSCDKASNSQKGRGSNITVFKEYHARDIVRSPCNHGYVFCEKTRKCIRPFSLVADGQVAELEKRFNEECHYSQQ